MSEMKVVWRKDEDTFSPQIIMMENNKVGIEVGGTMYIKTIEEWHKLAEEENDY